MEVILPPIAIILGLGPFVAGITAIVLILRPRRRPVLGWLNAMYSILFGMTYAILQAHWLWTLLADGFDPELAPVLISVFFLFAVLSFMSGFVAWLALKARVS